MLQFGELCKASKINLSVAMRDPIGENSLASQRFAVGHDAEPLDALYEPRTAPQAGWCEVGVMAICFTRLGTALARHLMVMR